ncbi:MAG: multiheme c-type cytochrome, partial [Acidobacteriota bacterium]|nr:multiheme c-type cytochrome [Acidobacteriota bacterium]
MRGSLIAFWAVAVAIAAVCGCTPSPDRQSERRTPTHVGRAVCAGCHSEQEQAWLGSDHDLAMDVASPDTVLGDFDDVEVEYYGITSRMFERDGRYYLRTDGPDGELHDYEIAYTFGVTPLQQYLVEFPRGRLQALPWSWDTRSVSEGGQRWFHLHPGEKIDFRDELHWTGLNQNWNYMCAECHSTDLEKNYDVEKDEYHTTWFEIDVSCEACHGPGSDHVEWARDLERRHAVPKGPNGLVVDLGSIADAQWIVDPETGLARRDPPRVDPIEIETCGRCHSRRGVFHEPYEFGKPLLDTHLPARIDGRLYWADGQILEEVYVYGSFLQSRMYRHGVTCSDCHDPHTLEVYGSPDTACGRCHLQSKFDTPEHHHHKAGTRGASCVACHMPSTDYMVVDPRRDHSLRNPRPDLTVKLGVPNACNGCHTDRSPRWAADHTAAWYGPPVGVHYGETLHAGWNRLPGHEQALIELAGDLEKPGIVRASAVAQLGDFRVPGALAAIQDALDDSDALVRHAALTTLEDEDAALVRDLVLPLLNDPVRAVRLEAANVLAAVPPDLLTDDQRAARDAGVEAYRASRWVNADRPESHMELGVLAIRQGQLGEAESAFRAALDLDPAFVPAFVNLADLYR